MPHNDPNAFCLALLPQNYLKPDWLEEYMNESFDECDEEDFPCKDNSFVDELTDEERAIADKYILDTYGIEVGTWEASGCYPPEGEYELILREE
mgnify:CR=1 FL=1